MNTTWQKAISDAVKARGYDGKGMSKEQFCFSQICKSIEELSEVCACFGVERDPYTVIRSLKISADYAKTYFNNPSAMGKVSLESDCVARELADVLVTLAMAADILGVDLEALALEKVNADVERGVRETVK